jgi:hypothetical protein
MQQLNQQQMDGDGRKIVVQEQQIVALQREI